MVRDLSMNLGFTKQIKSAIEDSVREYQLREQQEKREKRIRDSFKKLQSQFDFFFADMKQNGVNNNKDICRIFESLYP